MPLKKRQSEDAENLVGAKTEGPSLFDRRPPPAVPHRRRRRPRCRAPLSLWSL